ncbi:MAG TPA: DUF192 domain-containing protein [Flavobacteriaceae bacterium]|nr:DUF192 domain-containing protein [Flavobacteriaceae bacterium]
MKFRSLPFIVASSLFFGVVTLSCKEKPNKIEQAEVQFKKEGELSLFKKETDTLIKTLNIEIADNEYERQTGLMYRTSMEDNQGMLFVFEDSRPRYFYMKNTKIPLDLIFLDDNDTIVSFQENAQPLNENTLPSNAAAKYVLEINAGLVEKWKLQVGDSFSYSANN